MASILVMGPFGRVLPQPTASRANERSVLKRTTDESPSISDKMTPGGPFSKDAAIKNGAPGQHRQLPPVSHILGVHDYHDLALAERPSSRQGLVNFQRPQYSRGNSGESSHGPPGFYVPFSHPQPIQTHYRQRSEVLPPSPFSQPSPHQDFSPHSRTVPSLLSRSDGYVSSGSDTTREQARVQPRVLREENIPGKGVCYIYDDGTYCPKAIDGDSVNPSWGVTKAGKPRKRLAQACTTCREKKIRCDPGSGMSKCSQCLKFNRECIFEQQQK
jgi:Fungal Zn(2)-Cys(6) binuclear cluster domain